MKHTHGLYIGNAERPLHTGDLKFLKKTVRDLAPADRLRGWTIAPIPPEREPQIELLMMERHPLWFVIGAFLVLFVVYVVVKLCS